jgi:hypothetical protein
MRSILPRYKQAVNSDLDQNRLNTSRKAGTQSQHPPISAKNNQLFFQFQQLTDQNRKLETE